MQSQKILSLTADGTQVDLIIMFHDSLDFSVEKTKPLRNAQINYFMETIITVSVYHSVLCPFRVHLQGDVV